MEVYEHISKCTWCKTNKLLTDEELKTQICKGCHIILRQVKLLPVQKPKRPRTQLQIGERLYTVLKIDKNKNNGYKRNCNHILSENEAYMSTHELMHLPANAYKDFRYCKRHCGFWIIKIYYLEY